MWFDGQKLREERIAKGLTQAQLADMVGVEVCTIRNWERGRSRPQSFSLLHKTAESLGKLPEDFLICEKWGKMNGEKVRARRIALGLTLTDLSKRCGVTPIHVHGWESGRCRIRLAMEPLLANALECKISDLEDDVPNTVCEKHIVEVESDIEFTLLTMVLNAYRAAVCVGSAKQ